MKFSNKHKQVDLLVDENLLDEIAKVGIDNYPNECGGFLVGKYSEDSMELYITGSILPIRQKASSLFFERSSEGMKETLNELYRQKQHYYIGEWHTHPNGSTMYSQPDLNAMIEIESCNTVNIENPILLILSVDRESSQDFTFYLYDNKRLFPYE